MTEEKPDCMACTGATPEEMLLRQIFQGAIPLCRFHAASLEEVAGEDVELL